MSSGAVSIIFAFFAVFNAVAAFSYILGVPTGIGVFLYILHVILAFLSGVISHIYYEDHKRVDEPFIIPEADEIILVLAGNFQQYRNYVNKNNLSKCRVRYISQPYDIIGLRSERVRLVRVGTFWENPVCNSPELRELEQEIAYGK